MINKDKKILIISAWLPGGGVETVISNFSRIMSAKGYEIKVVSLSDYLEWNWFENKEFTISFYPVFKKENEINIFNAISNFRKVYKILQKEIKEYSPSNILITHTLLGLFVRKLKSHFDTSIYYWPMNTVFNTNTQGNKMFNHIYSFLKRKYVWYMVKPFDGAICISSQIQEQLSYIDETPAFLTFAPVNQRTQIALNESPGSPHFIFIGRIDQRKNLCFLLESLAQIKLDNWKLDIVGEGPEKERAFELSKSLGIQDNINWIGLRFPPFSEKPSYTSIIMTSLSEGFPMVIIDALLSGIPVICPSHLSIYNDAILESENGYGYEENSHESLKHVIEKIYYQREVYNGKHISEQCLNNFGDNEFFKRFLEILN
ncbi:glycosyltransferase [Marinifilum caeruleilacunae]|uniref:Glycosyltransferase n=1 Tax=Marinifilum caeruleilacunae TaxID=2499076 RepID=A0ABX1WSZ4_9BACT|nr:glycosyltransferase [Marinifilum caeruleilacunae]NOU59229.1 glycosyltransferase [Marinifilum caeruleilacunae]